MLLTNTVKIQIVVTEFLNTLHAELGKEIDRVTVTIHGKQDNFKKDIPCDTFITKKGLGGRLISYQQLDIDSPMYNNVTLVASALAEEDNA